MIGLRALVKKELREQLKTYKLPIMAAVFTMLVGVAIPLLLYLLAPEVTVVYPYSDPDMGISAVPVATSLIFVSYASNLEFWGVLAIVLIGMGAIARERSSGTAAMTLCKPVGRGAFVVAKLIGLCVTALISLALAGLACYSLTYILFEEVPNPSAFIVLNLLLGLFFVTCLSIVLLCSTLFKSQLAAGGLALAVIMGQGILSWIPQVNDYTPTTLLRWGTALILETKHVPNEWLAVGASLAVIVVCLFLSWQILQRKEL